MKSSKSKKIQVSVDIKFNIYIFKTIRFCLDRGKEDRKDPDQVRSDQIRIPDCTIC